MSAGLSLFQTSFPQRDRMSAAALMGLQVVTGLIILWQANVIRVKLATSKKERGDAACSNWLSIMATAVMIAALGMIIAPVAVFLVSITGNYGHFKWLSALEETYKAQYIALGWSVFMLVLLGAFDFALSKSNCSTTRIGGTIWIAGFINLIGCGILVVVRRGLDAKAITDAKEQLELAQKMELQSKQTQESQTQAQLAAAIMAENQPGLLRSGYAAAQRGANRLYRFLV